MKTAIASLFILALSLQVSAMPVAFTKNVGQWDEKVLYRTDAGGATIWIANDGIYYQFCRTVAKADSEERMAVRLQGVDDFRSLDRFGREADSVETLVIRASFVGSNANPQVISGGLMEYKCNYFLGNEPAKWHTDVPNYEAITLKDIYPGIDLKYAGDGNGQAAYEFVVAPGADIAQIKVEYDGAEGTSLFADGRMILRTKLGDLIVPFQTPAFGILSGTATFSRSPEYTTTSNFNGSSRQAMGTLAVGLTYSTYLGGINEDIGYSIAVDSTGSAYVTGSTNSSDFPTASPLNGGFNGGNNDVFVTKLSSDGNSLVYSTYLGGPNGEFGSSITVDLAGRAYVTGLTYSSDFPMAYPFDGSYKSGGDVFVTKLSSDGNSLVYSTYLGGTNDDVGYAIAVDLAGSAYVMGGTSSSNFPTANPFDGGYNGGGDAFVTKLSPAGNSLVYSTYLGGTGYDQGYDIAVDFAGSSYVSGRTSSSDFPTASPFDGSSNGNNDAFVTKLGPAGNSLVYSTYLGGTNEDFGRDIAVDLAGSAYVTGDTRSTNFPTANPLDGSYNSGGDVFVTKLSSDGNSLVYSTYLGGTNDDVGYAIAVDLAGSAYVMGGTRSFDFPTASPFDGSYNGSSDAFVTKLSPGGTRLIYSTYLGGTDSEEGYAIAVDLAGNAYVTGCTESSNFPTARPFDGSLGSKDAFVSKLIRLVYAGPTWHIDPNGDDSFGDGSETNPFASIQRGIDVAVDGDTVLVSKGIYLENLDLVQKSIVLASESGPDSTILQGAVPMTPILICDGSVDSTSEVSGFTFQNSNAIHLLTATDGSRVRIRGNKFTGLVGDQTLIFCHNSHPCIEKNLFISNTVGNACIGVYIDSTRADITNNTFQSNSRGFYCLSGLAVAKNNIVVGSSEYGVSGNFAVLAYNDVWNNGIDYDGGATPGLGNISADPLFQAPVELNFNLSANSPCVNAGDPEPIYNDPDGTRNDMGALPFATPDPRREVPHEYPTIQSAIDAAVSGDTVLVDNGHYFERINFLGKKITVASHYLIDADTMHIYQTIIDGDTLSNPIQNGDSSVVRFVSGEDSTCVLTGFTIRNGHGGIICQSSSPSFPHNRIVENREYGIRLRSSESVVSSCIVSNNSGHGIAFGSVLRSVEDCIISQNQGDGIHRYGVSEVSAVSRCRISHNAGTGILSMQIASVRDCLIDSNLRAIGYTAIPDRAEVGAAPHQRGWGTFTNVTVLDNGAGIQSADAHWTFDSCLFEGNALYGLQLAGDVWPTITNSTFRKNGTSTSEGGAINFRSGNPLYISISGTVFDGNIAAKGGAVYEQGGSTPNEGIFRRCTFINNRADSGAAVYVIKTSNRHIQFDSCIFAFNQNGPAIHARGSYENVSISCTNIFGNEGGDWTDSLAPQLGINGNISADPLFCDTASGDYHLRNSSPCAPENNECEALMGKYGVACENAAPEITSEDKVTAYEDIPFSYIADFSDVDGPTGLISYLHYPGWLSVDSTDLHGAPPNGSSDSSFLVIASDSFLADSLLVSISYVARNDAPVFPEMDSILVSEGDTLRLHLVATDIDGDDLHFAASDLPLNSSFVDSGNGSAVFEFSPDYTQAGFFQPAFTVEDDSLAADTLEVSVLVVNTNLAPTSPSVFAPIDSTEVLADDWLLWTESLDLDINDSLWYNVQIASNNLFEVLLCNVTIREDSLGPNPLVAKDAITGLQIGSIVCYGDLSDDSYYHWRVRGIDKYGGTSAFSPGSHVFFLNKANTPPHAVSATIYPKAGEPVNDLTPALSWYSASDPDPSDDAAHLRYFVLVDDNPDFAGPYVKSYWTAFGQPSVEVDSLTDETHHFYRIQTADDEGAVSVWSVTYDFWTNWRNDFPTSFSLALPPNNKLSVGVTPQFSWRRAIDNDPLDSVSYTLVLALDPGFLFKVEFAGIADTIFSLASPLSYSEDYWWTVKAVDLYEGITWSSQTFRFKTLVPGDADGNGVVTISDVVFLINYIFAGGAAPNPLDAGDANCSGGINISDAVYLIQYIFGGGAAPCEG